MKKIFTMGVVAAAISAAAQAEIAATHIYHNHMPNFWPYYDVSGYDALSVGDPIRYAYDGQVLNLKNNPPANYNFYIPGSGLPMPHDDLVAYYSHHAKVGAYQGWPAHTANENKKSHLQSQTHVTMSASVINNVQSFTELGNMADYHSGWGNDWKNTQQENKTAGGFNALDTIHFTGHHSMGPLVGNDYFLKDLIYHNVTLAQPYFLGDSFKSSNGFFPTELGFSERLIPILTKFDIKWSVLGNVHYSRTLRDYPYLNDPGKDTVISPPNRADLQNFSDVGEWYENPMFNEKQVTFNKFPFASTPHWVQYVDPETGEQHKVAGIPVEQASSWEEGYQGSVTGGFLKAYEGDAAGRTQYFVIAHDGDNSAGRAGDLGTWLNSGRVTYNESGVTGKGVDEYLRDHPIPADDVVHVQDGSWIDTRDSSADPTWYHWHIPMGVWAGEGGGQLPAFNQVNGTSFKATRLHMVSLELGYHYLERNFALLQAAENYAKTAEQIWLDNNPTYWSPSSDLDNEVTYSGNQLNPWMMSYPVKGDANNNYAGGANPAELGWYFLIASIDSGFGYYDENVDDGVKPTISFNQSLHFTQPYVDNKLSQDKTGPSIWWPQRYPYNPGSVNSSKAEGWEHVYADTKFAIYTYGYDVSGMKDIQVKVRVHKDKWADAKDKTFKLYDPAAHASDPDVDPTKVSDWESFDMMERDLTPDINGVDWQPSGKEMFEVVPAKEIGNLYYTYFDQYQEQLLDYYIEATDSKGNVTKSDIQQVYVGAGRYKMEGGKQVEAVDGNIAGEKAFFSDFVIPGNDTPVAVITPGSKEVNEGEQLTLSGASSSDADGTIVSYLWSNGETTPSIDVTINERSTYSLTVTDDLGSKNTISETYRILGQTVTSTIYYKDTNGWGQVCLHYTIDGTETWTVAPGVEMQSEGNDWYSYTVDLDYDLPLEFVANSCNGAWDNNGGSNYQAEEGIWKITAGAISTGIPDDLDSNLAPVAHISPASQTVEVGTQVTLSGAGSSDSDGSIASYLWSTGETSQSISLTVNENQTISLTVTDDGGKTHTTSVTLTVPVNVAPTAVISPESQTVEAGSVVQLSAAGSSDSDGSIASYLWSTGETTDSISVTVNETTIVSVTVTDNQGATATTDVELKVEGEDLQSNFSQLYFRGTANAWQATPMTLVADNTWQLDVELDGQDQQRFKFDVTGDWSQNYGDDGSDGSLEQTGADIFTDLVGAFTIEVNDASMTYTIAGGDINLSPTAVINASATKVDIGQSVSLSAAASSDSDGSIVSYLWSNGDSSDSISVSYAVAGTYSLSVTVTDDGGKTAEASVSIEVSDPNANYQANFDQFYFRGTANGWLSTAMTLVADNTWQTVVVLDGQDQQRFKFDVNGDWSYNFGDNNSDGVLEQSGSDIYTDAVGSYVITIDDTNMSYSIVAQ